MLVERDEIVYCHKYVRRMKTFTGAEQTVVLAYES
jgi:hypothetical protein